MPLVVLVLALVDLSIWTGVLALAVPLVVPPLALIDSSIWPGVLALAVPLVYDISSSGISHPSVQKRIHHNQITHHLKYMCS